ncbi:TetR/AcrR family transcriptional regulator [Paraburkholderia sp. GAS348]|uniref:TetR/AcrR family transcriptional regulator n=1 Tax=Paraburkholderia sp. GAS348 TaxID=3035132 RepID=UPI003D1F909F
MVQNNARTSRLSRVEQQALTRRRLVSAAESAFSRFGYEGASLELIAAEAGYTRGALYFNFPDKEALFSEVLRLYMEGNIAALERIDRLQPERIFDAVANWVKTTQAGSQLIAELMLHTRRSTEFAARYHAFQKGLIDMLARVLERHFAAQSMANPVDAVHLADGITALARGLSLKACDQTAATLCESGAIIDKMLRVLIRV